MAGMLSVLISAGCASTPPHKVVLTGDIMVDGPKMIAEGPPRDKMLWQYRTASAAMRRGQFDTAKPLLNDALLDERSHSPASRGYSDRAGFLPRQAAR